MAGEQQDSWPDPAVILKSGPCSPLQSGILLSQIRCPGLYELVELFEIKSSSGLGANVEKLKEAWRVVVRQHGMLRTVFKERPNGNGTFEQILHSAVEPRFELFSPETDISPAECLQKLRADAGMNPLGSTPPINFCIFATRDGVRFCGFRLSHALSDAASIAVLVRDLIEAYEGRFPHHPPFDYHDYVEYLSVQDNSTSVEYWGHELWDVTPTIFPASPAAGEQQINLESTPVSLTETQGLEVLRFCNIHGVTLTAFFHTVWALVLKAYTGADSPCFGYLVTDRGLDSGVLDDAVGPCMNLIPSCIRTEDDMRILDIMEIETGRLFERFQNRHISMATLKQKLGFFSNQLFNTVVSIQKHTGHVVGKAGTTMKAVATYDPTEFDIVLNVNDNTEGFDVSIAFWTSCICSEQARRISGTVAALIKSVLAHPKMNLVDFPHISEMDLKDLQAWNTWRDPMEETLCIHDVIEERSRFQPQAEAVCSWDIKLTYSELGNLSDRLACRLVELGVASGCYVPVCMEKSGFAPVAILAILKASGAYVPLDPSHPFERRKAMLQTVDADIVISSRQHASEFGTVVRHVIPLDMESLNSFGNPRSRLTLKAQPSDAAIVYFTSGSTGIPKGIIIEHGAMLKSWKAHGPVFGLCEGSRVLQFAAYTFDVSVAEILSTLMSGGCICIPSQSERVNNLAAAINRLGANWAFLTPTVASLLKPEEVPCLKTLLLGGEHATRDNFQTWAPSLRLINTYGPSECSIWTTCALNISPDSDPANLGRHVGCNMWVVDSRNHNKLMPIGAPGELVIQSKTLARGYLKDPKKSKAAFIHNPEWLTERDGENNRVYKTGDIVRYNVDGTVSYCSRKDNQVKINGQRVELGEIEQHISACAGIRHAVAVLPTKGKFRKQLLAVVSLELHPRSLDTASIPKPVDGVHTSAAKATVKKLTNTLGEHLPRYMIPAAIVAVESIPRTTSGKLDRRVLIQWLENIDQDTHRNITGHMDTAVQEDFDLPESMIRDAWSSVLNVPADHIGLRTPFMALGGDSISAMQVTARCRQTGWKVTVQDILQCKTIARLALRASPIDTNHQQSSYDEVMDRPFPLSPMQSLFLENTAGAPHFAQSFLLQLMIPITESQFYQALRKAFDHHPMLRARFRQDGAGKWHQFIPRDNANTYRLVTHHLDECCIEAISERARRGLTSMDIEHGPLVSVDFFEFTNHPSMTFMAIHHLVIDLVSWRILLQDIEDIINQDHHTLEKGLPFSAWCELQEQQAAQDIDLASIMPSPFKEIAPPADFWELNPRQNTYGRVVNEKFSLSRQQTENVLGICNAALRTEPLDILLASVANSFLSIFQDREAVNVFTEGHGREPYFNPSLDLSRTVGWFTTMFPILATPSTGLLAQLIQIKDSRRSVPGNGLPYFLHNCLGDEKRQNVTRDLRNVEILFNYLGQYQQLEKQDSIFRQRPWGAVEPPNYADDAVRFAYFEIHSVVEDGQMQVHFNYHAEMRHSSSIKRWVERCQQDLNDLINTLAAQEYRTFTASDFPALKLDVDAAPRLTHLANTFKDVEIEDVYPCSYMQESLLMANKENPRLYNVCQIWKLRHRRGDELDAYRVKQAWTAVIKRHTVLRTIFVESIRSDGMFDQVVLPSLETSIIEVHCQTEDIMDVLEAMQRQAPLEVQLQKLPFQAAICITPSGAIYFKLEASHAVIDGTSVGRMMADMDAAYHGLQLPPAPSYGEYVKYCEKLSKQDGVDYWTQTLAQAEICYFPMLTDGRKTTSFKTISFEFGDITTIRNFCLEHLCTVSTIIQTAWGLMLHQYCGQDSVTFGCLTSGRDISLEAIELAVGPFIHMLVCSMDFSAENSPKVLEVLEATADRFAESMRHQHVSLADIQHALSTSGKPLFDTAISVQKGTRKTELMCFDEVYARDPSEYAVVLNVLDEGDSISATLSYWGTTLCDSQAHNLQCMVKRAVSAIVEAPNQPIDGLDLMPPEHASLISSWNLVDMEGLAVPCLLHEGFEQRVREQPAAQSIEAQDQSLTYAELDSYACFVADQLISVYNLQSGSRVSCVFDRSALAIVAMLGILKAGCVIIPLDPTHPKQRLEDIISQAHAETMVTSVAYQDMQLTGVVTTVVLGINSTVRLPGEIRLKPVESSQPAYIIFTSGSTGKPKGVVVSHMAICSSISSHGKAVNLHPGSRVLQFASHAFDACIAEIFTTLTFGGCVCIPEEQERLNNLASAMTRMRVTYAILMASVARTLRPKDVPYLETLALGGEPIGDDNTMRWNGPVQLLNVYGPTEASVICFVSDRTSQPCRPEFLGRMYGGRAWVARTNNFRHLAPIGAVGELLLEGPILASGYLHDPGMTAAAFVDHVDWNLGRDMPRRLYRTGDLVRYDSDGQLVFLRRKDTQVKLRGQRIELGEIEHHLLADPEVRHAQVLLPGSGPLAMRIAAVLCLQSMPSTSRRELEILDNKDRATAAFTVKRIESSLAVLPSYMMPTAFIVVEDLPLLSTGKLNRRRVLSWLQGLDESAPMESYDFLPRGQAAGSFETEFELGIVKMLSLVLNISNESIRPDRSFTYLGGDSISAMQVVSHCRRANISMAVGDILRSKTVAELVSLASKRKKPMPIETGADMEPLKTDEWFSLSPIQSLLFSIAPGGTSWFNQCFMLRIRHAVCPEDIRAALLLLIDRHPMLKASFRRNPEGRWVQQIPSYKETLLDYSEISVGHICESESQINAAQTRLCIEKGPLVSLVFIETQLKPETVVAISIHHLVVDLVSWRVLLDDLECLLRHKEPLLPTGSFYSWRKRQEEGSFNNSVETETDAAPGDESCYSYWSIEPNSNTYGDVLATSFELASDATDKLLGEANTRMSTESIDILIAALLYSFPQSFPRGFGPQIYVEGHGRDAQVEDVDLTRTVAWFTMIQPLVSQSSFHDSLLGTLRFVKEARRSRELDKSKWTLEHPSIPMEILFNYIGQYQQLERSDGLFEQLGPSDLGFVPLDTDPSIARLSLFDVNAVVSRGSLQITVTWSKHMNSQDRILNWIISYQESISLLINQLMTGPREFTPSDFPLLKICQDDLQTFIGRLTADHAIQIENIEEIFPCTPLQTGILVSQSKNPDQYQVRQIWEVCTLSERSNVDETRLCTAWQRVVARHPILRSIFVEDGTSGSAFCQVVLKTSAARVEFVSEQEFDLILTGKETQQRVNGSEGQPSHLLSIYQSPTTTYVCLDINHAITDGTSTSIILQDLQMAYDQLLPNTAGPSYSRYFAHIEDKVGDPAGKAFWKEFLTDVTPCQLPECHDEIEPQSRLELTTITLPHTIIEELRSLCRQNNLTLPNVFEAAWAMVLSTYVGGDDICFGYLASGRDIDLEGVEDTVGPLINMLVCRYRDIREQTPSKILEAAAENYRKALPYQSVPLLEIEHSSTNVGGSLFNTVLSYQKLLRPSDQSTLRFSHVGGSDPSEYALSLNIIDAQESFSLVMNHWTNKISRGYATNLLDAVVKAIEIIKVNTDGSWSSSDLISDSALKQIWAWNEYLPRPVMSCLHDLVGQQARRRPHAEAIYSSDVVITYAELDWMSSMVKHKLQMVGVGPGAQVPILFEKSAWAIIAMLGTMKSGAAWVPLDPTYPTSRLDTIVDMLHGQTALASSRYSHVAKGLKGISRTIEVNSRLFAKQIMNDHLPEHVSPDRTDCQARASTPLDTAYILFTSGSTGTPKGVVLTHAAVCSSALAHGRAMHFSETTRSLQFSAYNFDACIAEIFTTLIHGGTVCSPSNDDRLENLAEYIRSMGVNWSFLTPTVADFLDPSTVPTLQTLILGGEAVTETAAVAWRGHVTLMNGYGPTETCVFCVTHALGNRGAHTIGAAVGGVCWIVDPLDQETLMPIGATGELVIEGPALASGYLKDQQRTDEAFVEAPAWLKLFRRNTSKRIYKTGDLVRYHPDGSIEYLGRKDLQVKIRGQRVEISDIEYHLSLSLPKSWKSAVVLARVNGRSDPSLVAFYSKGGDGNMHAHHEAGLESDVADHIRSSRRSIASKLPKHMAPSMYIPVDSLPLTTSGKLDRRRLQHHAERLTPQELSLSERKTQEISRPKTQTEAKLQLAWASLLGMELELVDLDDNFFHLGGDSVIALRLVMAARDEQIRLTVADIFHNPQLRDLARVAIAHEAPHESPVPIHFSLSPSEDLSHLVEVAAEQCGVDRNLIEDILPCTPLQEGLLAVTMRQPGAYVANHVFTIPKTVDLGRFKAAWQAIVDNVPILRTRLFYADSVGCLQVVIKSGIEWVDSSSLDSYLHGVQNAAVAYGSALTAYAIVKQGEDRIFVWTTHHSIYDGWSMQLILKHVHDFYFSKRSPSGLPFSIFVQYLLDVNQAEAEQYWRNYLHNASQPKFPRVSSLPSRPSKSDARLHRPMTIGSVKGSAVTTPTLLVAAFAITLGCFMDSKDVVFGYTGSGRNSPLLGITEIVGPTLSTRPVRVQWESDSGVLEFLHNLQLQLVDAVRFEHLGIQNIRRISNSALASCEFETLLVIQNQSTNRVDTAEALGMTRQEHNTGGYFNYALTCQCSVTETEIDMEVDYDSSVLKSGEMDDFVRAFEQVFHSIQHCDDTILVDKLDLVSDVQKEKIVEWAGNDPIVSVKCLHELFMEQAGRNPHDPAIISEPGEMPLTYADVDGFSSRLALLLLESGTRPGSVVSVMFGKSPWAIVAMIAILKAGCAFLPLDPSSPVNRLNLQIQETGSNILLSSPDTVELPSIATRLVVERTMLEDLDIRHRSLPSTSMTDLAYVMFTSGSTGKPKGVQIQHISVSSSIEAQARFLELDWADTRILQYTAHTFDVSISEIFLALTKGGCLCIPSESERLNDIAGAINRMNANVAFLTPAVARILQPADVPGLQTLVLGGEPVTQDVLQTWNRSIEVINGYGPTECSIFVTFNRFGHDNSQPERIGKSLSSCRCWIADAEDPSVLLPPGCVGELLVEGPLLALGYINDPDNTNANFIDRPSWMPQRRDVQGSSQALYRTGDLVKYDEDGIISYVGRRDSQMKIHGQRIEAGEIEHHIRKGEGIRNVVVIVPKHGHLRDRLVAALVPSATKLETWTADATVPIIRDVSGSVPESISMTITSVRDSISNHLPGHMLPSVWLPLMELPLLASGKIDRRKILEWLKTLEHNSISHVLQLGERTQDDVAEVLTQDEEAVRQLCANVLNLSETAVSVAKSFVRLGGDSITAMQLVSKARQRGLNMLVGQVLRCKDLKELARVCHEGTNGEAAEAAVGPPALPRDIWTTSGRPFDLSPVQNLLFRIMPHGEQHFNQSFFLGISKPLSVSAVSEAIHKLVRRHAALRILFRRERDIWQQFVSTKESAFLFEHISSNDPQHMAIASSAVQKKLHLQHGPLFAAVLFGSGEDMSLFLTCHHAIVDLVSWRIILGDLELLILEPSSWSEEEPVTYPVWVESQKQLQLATPLHVSEEGPAVDLDFWAVEPESNTYGNAVTSNVSIPSELTSFLMAPREHFSTAQPVEIMLAALLYSMIEAFPTRTTIPGLFNELHGRHNPGSNIDLSRTVGWFTTMAPITVTAKPTSFGEALAMVQKARRVSDYNARDWLASYFSSRMDDHRGRPVPFEVLFNYAGRYQQLEKADALFHQMPSHIIAEVKDINPNAVRFSIFDVAAVVANEELVVSFTWPSKMANQTEAHNWVDTFARTIRGAVEYLSRANGQSTISKQDIICSLPCLPIQKTMLASQARSNLSYRVRLFWEVHCSADQPVEVDVLLSAWAKMIQRHAALRSFFHQSDTNNPVQLVSRNTSSGRSLVNRSLKTVETISALRRAEPAMISTTDDSLHSFTVFEAANGRVCCQLDISHTIIDGHSIGVIFTEFSQALRGQLATSNPTGNVDAFCERDSRVSSLDSSYWKSLLRNAEPTHFPCKRDCPREVRCRVDMESLPLQPLLAFCRKHSITIAALVHTAWAMVLHRLVKQDSIVFGYLDSGRNEGNENAVGLFINLLMHPFDFGRNLSALHILEGAADVLARNLEHQPLARVEHIEEFWSRKSSSETPLCNSIINFRKFSNQVAGTQFEMLWVDDPWDDETDHPDEQYDLNVEVAEVWDAENASLQCSLEWYEGSLDDPVGKRAASLLRSSMESLIADPDHPIKDCIQGMLR
ncbi:putative Nonribosomal peptide synthase [Seiridium cardinale]|uniref:Nonribosomal peptide synthase n=1 Tax=Seiridium cardinale TaxID=138064 RepID=A0ABR2XGW6_9PEZI